jgi:hypothetical protein
VHITKNCSAHIVETIEFFPTEVALPFLSTKYLATEATTQLMHALLHPQPSEKITQVVSEQTLTLKCMAAIFKGALL